MNEQLDRHGFAIPIVAGIVFGLYALATGSPAFLAAAALLLIAGTFGGRIRSGQAGLTGFSFTTWRNVEVIGVIEREHGTAKAEEVATRLGLTLPPGVLRMTGNLTAIHNADGRGIPLPLLEAALNAPTLEELADRLVTAFDAGGGTESAAPEIRGEGTLDPPGRPG